MPRTTKSPWFYFDVEFPYSNGKFSYEDWSLHRSWLRYWLQPRIFLLVVYNQLPLLLWVWLVSICLTLYYELGQKQHAGWLVVVSKDYIQPFILTSFALSLLLVFRTTTAFERWYSYDLQALGRPRPIPGISPAHLHFTCLAALANTGGRCTTTCGPWPDGRCNGSTHLIQFLPTRSCVI